MHSYYDTYNTQDSQEKRSLEGLAKIMRSLIDNFYHSFERPFASRQTQHFIGHIYEMQVNAIRSSNDKIKKYKEQILEQIKSINVAYAFQAQNSELENKISELQKKIYNRTNFPTLYYTRSQFYDEANKISEWKQQIYNRTNFPGLHYTRSQCNDKQYIKSDIDKLTKELKEYELQQQELPKKEPNFSYIESDIDKLTKELKEYELQQQELSNKEPNFSFYRTSNKLDNILENIKDDIQTEQETHYSITREKQLDMYKVETWRAAGYTSEDWIKWVIKQGSDETDKIIRGLRETASDSHTGKEERLQKLNQFLKKMGYHDYEPPQIA